MSDHDLKVTFWNRIENVNVGMLSATATDPRPMAHHARKDDNALWFLTSRHTDIGEDAAAGKDARYQIASGDAKIYATIDGSLAIETDRAKLEEIWFPWIPPGLRTARATPTCGWSALHPNLPKCGRQTEQPRRCMIW